MNLPTTLYRTLPLALTGSAVLALGIMSGFAMPAPSEPEREQAASASSAEPEAERPVDRPDARKRVLQIRVNADALRTRLNRSILRAEQTLKLHRAALEKLDEGASVSEVLSELKGRNLRPNANDTAHAEHRPAQQRAAAEPRNPNLRGNERPKGAQRPDADRLTPREREMMRRFIRENFPELSQNLQLIVEHDPRSADRLLVRMSPRIREILLLENTQPDLAKIKTAEMRIGMNFVEASRVFRTTMNNPDATPAQRAEALANLEQAASERFDIQLKAKQFEVSKLEARLNELKASVDSIKGQREVEIEHMVKSAKRNSSRANRATSKPPNASNDSSSRDD